MAQDAPGAWEERLRWALLALATLIVEVVALDAGQGLWRAGALALFWMSVLWLARRVLAGRRAFAMGSVWTTVFALVLASVPWVQARFGGAELAPEIVLLLAFRNLSLVLAALPAHDQTRRLNGFIGLCLVTFCVALAREGAVIGVAALYTALGSAWLACSYWNARHWSDSGAITPPWGAFAAAIFVVTATFGAALMGSSRETTALRGWVPGSGGTGKWSFQARGGVHDDGDAEVGATKDAWSVGFVDTEVFIESKQNSLYDTFSDTYGNPIPPKERQRKVVVPFQNFIERHTEPAENHDADQQFSTRRTPPRDREANPSSRAAKALLYVRGRVPLHLRIVAYDRFDGEQWHRELPSKKGHDLEREAKEATNQQNYLTNSSWMRFNTFQASPYFGGIEEHHVKIGTLQTNRVLAPGRLERLRIGRLDRPEFFKWAHDDILLFDAPRFPAATTFVTHTRTSDPRLLLGHRFESAARLARYDNDALYFSMPGRVDPLVRQLAKHWTRDVPRGWAQVEAISAGLRARCRHEPGAVTASGQADSVSQFLRTRRGPDYLFATSAVLMLRGLGYPSRMVSGFYARPERFDARTEHTLVQAQDAHFWPEVLLPRTIEHAFDRAWIPIEPTPGYHLLLPQQTWSERALAVLAAAWKAMSRHAFTLLLLLALGAAMGRWRRPLIDALATWMWLARWQLMPRRSAARHIETTLQLLEARGRRAGCPRPPGTTPARWLAPLLGAFVDESAKPNARSTHEAVLRDGRFLLQLADHAAFAPRGAAWPCADDDTRALCIRVVKAWKFAVLQREMGLATRVPQRTTSLIRGVAAWRARLRFNSLVSPVRAPQTSLAASPELP